MFYFDWTFILIIIGMVISGITSAYVQNTFRKYDQVGSERQITGAGAAKWILDHEGIRDVKIERVRGNLSDHYDPRNKVLRLSDATYSSTSVAAVGVAAHEVGHAIQHSRGYLFLRLRSAIYPVTNIGSKLSFPILFLGLILGGNQTLINIGIILFSFTLLFQVITLPVEFDASSRALKSLQNLQILNGREIQGSKSVLRAAALTYVAATLASALSLLRVIFLFGNRRD